jgi:hypothetical protein
VFGKNMVYPKKTKNKKQIPKTMEDTLPKALTN